MRDRGDWCGRACDIASCNRVQWESLGPTFGDLKGVYADMGFGHQDPVCAHDRRNATVVSGKVKVCIDSDQAGGLYSAPFLRSSSAVMRTGSATRAMAISAHGRAKKSGWPGGPQTARHAHGADSPTQIAWFRTQSSRNARWMQRFPPTSILGLIMNGLLASPGTGPVCGLGPKGC